MFNLPENAPWGAVLAVSVFLALVFRGIRLWSRTWPQNSGDRRADIEAWHRDRAERRKELGRKQDRQDR